MTDYVTYVKRGIARIDRSVKPSAYGLLRGQMFELMISEVLKLLGIAAGCYYQNFPKNAYQDDQPPAKYPEVLRSKRKDFGGSGAFIKGYQKDLWVVGGSTGTRYPIEVKERRHHQGLSVFSYPDVRIGKVENWDLKNVLAQDKPGYKGVLAMVIVCGYTGDVRVTLATLKHQAEWGLSYYKKETSYNAPIDNFISLEDFVKYIQTL